MVMLSLSVCLVCLHSHVKTTVFNALVVALNNIVVVCSVFWFTGEDIMAIRLHILYAWIRIYAVAAGGGGEEALSRRRRHFKQDLKISACVWSFKCFTAFGFRPPEVFCDVQIHPWPGLHPIRTLGSSPHSSRLGPPARRGGRTSVCLGHHRPLRRHCI